MLALFAILRPLKGIKTLEKHFYLIEEVLSFELGVKCKNPLEIGFRNEYLTFTSQNKVDLDDLHLLKIGFKIGFKVSHKISCRMSCKISNSISYKISCKISHSI